MEDFTKSTAYSHKDGLLPLCRVCSKARQLRHREANRERRRIGQARYVAANPDKVKASNAAYRAANREKLRAKNDPEYKARYYRENKEKLREMSERWKSENSERYRRSCKLRLSRDDVKLGVILRGRLNKALRHGYKAGSAVSDLGCSIEEFKIYLESLWAEGMTWDNYGRKGWHIDHKIPLTSFDLSDREQFLKAAHYTNMQPLWALDNLSKGTKLDWQPVGEAS